jgi:hypothetical protein
LNLEQVVKDFHGVQSSGGVFGVTGTIATVGVHAKSCEEKGVETGRFLVLQSAVTLEKFDDVVDPRKMTQSLNCSSITKLATCLTIF